MSDANAASEPETADEKEIYDRITTIYRAVKWKALEVGIKQLLDEGDPGDVAMGLIAAAMWIEEQNRNVRKDKTEQTKRKEIFLQLVADTWDDEQE
jgi:hypothetical protein